MDIYSSSGVMIGGGACQGKEGVMGWSTLLV